MPHHRDLDHASWTMAPWYTPCFSPERFKFHSSSNVSAEIENCNPADRHENKLYGLDWVILSFLGPGCTNLPKNFLSSISGFAGSVLGCLVSAGLNML